MRIAGMGLAPSGDHVINPSILSIHPAVTARKLQRRCSGDTANASLTYVHCTVDETSYKSKQVLQHVTVISQTVTH